MSDTPASTTNPNAPAAPAKSRKKLLLIIIVLLVVGGGGGVGGFFYFQRGAEAKNVSSAKGKKGKKADKESAKKSSDDETEEEEESDETASGAEDDEKKSDHAGKKGSADKVDDALSVLEDDGAVKHVMEMQPFIINLADSDQARYLRLSISLGFSEGGGKGEEEKPDPLFTTRVRNAVLAVLTTKTSDEILTVEGKKTLRKQLLKAVQSASEEPHVEAVYITDFIVQL